MRMLPSRVAEGTVDEAALSFCTLFNCRSMRSSIAVREVNPLGIVDFKSLLSLPVIGGLGISIDFAIGGIAFRSCYGEMMSL